MNARSRRGREWFRQAAELMPEKGIDLVRAHIVRNPKKLGPYLDQATREKVPLIVVGGGDGTLGTAATHLVKSQSVMGVLPLGTGNAFARDLGIRADVSAAVDVLATGKVQAVDLGQANDQVFVNVATVGLTTRIAEELTVEAKRTYGRCVYMFALLRALARVRPFTAELKLPTIQETFTTLQVVIGSGKYHAGPFPIEPGSSITDGELSIYVLAGKSRAALVRYALTLPGGRHVNLPEVVPFRAPRGKLTTRPVGRVVADGEMRMKTPLDFKLLPRALKVMVPKDAEL